MEGMKNFQECAASIASSTVCGQLEPQVSSLTAPRASQGGHRTTLTCKKKKKCTYKLTKKLLWGLVVPRVLLRLYGLSLWPNDLIRGY